MGRTNWKPFPHVSAAYDYAGEKLKKNWARLHRGDCESFPDETWTAAICARHEGLAPKGGSAKAATTLQEAWRAYHRGDFARAVELGASIGPLGSAVASKASNIYASYLEPDAKQQLAIFEESAARCEDLAKIAPEYANAFYFSAQALGRYSQGISVVAALTQGIGGRVLAALKKAVALEPKHADAEIGLGVYNAEVISKVGSVVGKLTYGASKEAAIVHFEKALKLNPGSAIAHIEFANGLVMMFGKSKLEAATSLYRKASGCTPMDAMERLDVEAAKAELE
jgi:tetratricopeptide (TPR) repeat protein